MLVAQNNLDAPPPPHLELIDVASVTMVTWYIRRTPWKEEDGGEGGGRRGAKIRRRRRGQRE